MNDQLNEAARLSNDRYLARERHRLLIQDISFKLYKAEHGMGMPYSRDDVLHYRRLLIEALAAEIHSADVQLAAKLVQS